MRELISIVGYCLVLICSIILGVILVEFDVEAHEAKAHGILVEGTVHIQNGQYRVTEEKGVVYTLTRTEHLQLKEGQLVIGYSYPDSTLMLSERSMPHVPRGVNDLIFAIVAMLCAMSIVAVYPKTAFVDLFAQYG